MKRILWYAGVCVLLLAILMACGGREGAAPVSSIPVQITETDFQIASSMTSFVPGRTYHFLVTNRGSVLHEFMILPHAPGRMQGMSMADMDEGALAHLSMIGPGQTRTFDYAFPASVANTRPEFACALAGHYEAGMRLEVRVAAGHTSHFLAALPDTKLPSPIE